VSAGLQVQVLALFGSIGVDFRSADAVVCLIGSKKPFEEAHLPVSPHAKVMIAILQWRDAWCSCHRERWTGARGGGSAWWATMRLVKSENWALRQAASSRCPCVRTGEMTDGRKQSIFHDKRGGGCRSCSPAGPRRVVLCCYEEAGDALRRLCVPD
jgi:hypothetical protein